MIASPFQEAGNVARRKNNLSDISSIANLSRTSCPNRRDVGIFKIRARINEDLWAGTETSTLSTLTFVAQTGDSLAAACVKKSLQLLPVSAPSARDCGNLSHPQIGY